MMIVVKYFICVKDCYGNWRYATNSDIHSPHFSLNPGFAKSFTSKDSAKAWFNSQKDNFFDYRCKSAMFDWTTLSVAEHTIKTTPFMEE